MLSFYKRYSYILLFILCSCSGETEDKMAESTANSDRLQIPAISYRMIETEKKIMDETAPLGEWSLFVSYPEIDGLINEKLKTDVNELIIKLANKYRCNGRGEHAFSSEVMFMDEKIFSMAYEAMLFCSPMSSPASSSGSLNINLTSGEVIILQPEFISQPAESEFHLLIENKIKTQQNSGEVCPVKNTVNYFYKTKTAVVFVLDADRHSDSACVIDIELTTTELMTFLRPQSLLLH